MQGALAGFAAAPLHFLWFQWVKNRERFHVAPSPKSGYILEMSQLFQRVDSVVGNRAARIIYPGIGGAIRSWAVLTAVTAVLLALTLPPTAAATRVRRQATAGHHRHHQPVKRKHKIKGQRAMEPQRVTEIQQALIREHYLQGEPSGKWDASSQAAIEKFQAANNWQTKVTPDSRALIKLGLGPKQDAGEYAASSPGLSANPAGAVSTPTSAHSMHTP